MKTSIRTILPPILAYIALPFCLVAAAGVIGFFMVAGLDLCFGIFFVDGIPVAASLVMIVSLVTVRYLLHAGESTFDLMRFIAPLRSAKTAWSSFGAVRLTRVLSSALSSARQIGRQVCDSVSAKEESSYAESHRFKTVNARRDVIHSVVWGNSLNLHYAVNRSMNLERRSNHAAQQ